MSFTWRGVGSLCTRVPRVYQWPDTASIAFGLAFSKRSPTLRSPCATSSSRSAIMGSPWPTKMAGCLDCMFFSPMAMLLP